MPFLKINGTHIDALKDASVIIYNPNISAFDGVVVILSDRGIDHTLYNGKDRDKARDLFLAVSDRIEEGGDIIINNGVLE